MRPSRRPAVSPLAAALCAVWVLCVLSAGRDASAAQPQSGDGVQLLLRRLEQAVQTGAATDYNALLGASADRDRARDFVATEVAQPAARAVLQERDREPLRGAPAGEAYRLIVDAFAEFGNRARVATWRLDVRRVDGMDADHEWTIVDEERISSLENLFRLSV